MREFSPEYLSRTRRGMWADTRDALRDLALDSRTRILEVGCGTGEFTAVLREESNARLVGLDADPELLAVAADTVADLQTTAGAAGRLPFPPDSFDLVVCQALLVNLPNPAATLREFTRVSSDLVAAVEPVNRDVSVESTVAAEAGLETEARAAFIAGAETGVDGDDVREWFDAADLAPRVRRYEHEKRIEPPYSEADLRGAAQKATAAALADHERELERSLGGEYDDLRRRWREMGREVVEQMRRDEYRRVERVPFDVSVASTTR